MDLVTPDSAVLRVGFADAMSGLDYSSLSVRYFEMTPALNSQLEDISNSNDVAAAIAAHRQLSADAEQTIDIELERDIDSHNILTRTLALEPGEYVLTVVINDLTGNTQTAHRRFIIN